MLSINFTDAKGKVTKTYSAIGMKMGLVEKLMDISEQQRITQIGQPSVAEQKELWAAMGALVVEVFGRQFTYDELMDGVEIKELIRCFNNMSEFITEAVSKN